MERQLASLQSPLPSLASAASPSVLFGEFTGTTRLSDFPRPSIIGVRPLTFRHGLQFSPLQTDVGSPGSRTRCLHTCTGSLTARDLSTPRAGGVPSVAFRLSPRRRHPEEPVAFATGHIFHGSIPDLYVPLSTLRSRPRERLRMTRGPLWFAIPSTYETFIHNTLPVLTGARRRT